MNIFEFGSADAWCSFCRVHSASKFGVADLFVFERNALPAREAYPDGGCWVVNIDSRTSKQLDDLWFHAVQELTGDMFGANGLLGISLSCMVHKAELALWVGEYSTVDAESVGRAFQTFLGALGNVDHITFVHFGYTATSPRVPEEMVKGATSPAKNGSSYPQDLRDTGQMAYRQPCNMMVLVLPDLAKAGKVQVVLKNSFIHAVVPFDEPLPAPELQRMRTV